MKLTKENIEVINATLIKNGVHYIDIRIEIIDHFASELEKMDGDFETNFPLLLDNSKDFLKQMQLSFQKLELSNGFRNLFRNIFSKRFLIAYFFFVLFIVLVVNNVGSDQFLYNLELIPILLPGPITLILLYTTFASKSKSRDLIGLLSATNLILFSYIFVFLPFIRSGSLWTWVPVFSFFMVLSFFYYIFYFESKKEYKSKYESLWN
ncbi:hypothetical protein [Flavobacterium tegetincola]|uniref:hypothetical protein n=1 Tax=Flavobacterium tegetincola TaxID=150172 RepID=UPI0004188212|nr:hypothetical protein [Flavobacterium tegetincola]